MTRELEPGIAEQPSEIDHVHDAARTAETRSFAETAMLTGAVVLLVGVMMLLAVKLADIIG